MSALVLGAGGMLGRAWVSSLDQAGVSYIAATRSELDIASPNLALPAGVDRVINCAAYTDVDAAEADEAAATEVNGHAVHRLVEACDRHGAQLVHYSTDYVFDGVASSPYPVDRPTAPLNAYGRSKRVGERAVQASPGGHLLVRTSWVYAPWGKNFVRTMARLTKERDTVSVVDDQRGRPTSARELARISLELLDGDHSGTFHVTDGGECTWFELARFVASRVAPACDVRPCTSEAFPRPAARPAYSVLDLSRTENAVGPLTPWRDAVAAALAQMQ